MFILISSFRVRVQICLRFAAWIGILEESGRIPVESQLYGIPFTLVDMAVKDQGVVSASSGVEGTF